MEQVQQAPSQLTPKAFEHDTSHSDESPEQEVLPLKAEAFQQFSKVHGERWRRKMGRSPKPDTLYGKRLHLAHAGRLMGCPDELSLATVVQVDVAVQVRDLRVRKSPPEVGDRSPPEVRAFLLIE